MLATTENIFKEVRDILNQDFEILIKDWFQNAYRVNDDIWKTGDFNDTKAKKGDGSLVIHMRDKYAKDFATGETAGDLISIYAHRFCNGDQKRALKELIQKYNLVDYLKNNTKLGNSYPFLDRWMTEGKNSGDINNYTTVGQIENLQQFIAVRNDENSPTKDIDDKTNTEAGLPTSQASDSAEVQNGSRKTSPKITSRIYCSPEVIRGTRLDSDSNNTSTDLEKNNKIKNILSNIHPYSKNDPVDLYLKSRGISNYSPNTYIVNTGNDGDAIMVNLCYRTVKNSEEEYSRFGKLYRRTNDIAGIQEIFLTKDGRKKKDNGGIPSKIQRTFSNNTISGNPVRLEEKGDNNGYIYITEGVENGLSLQQYINNEVWCALSIVNIPNLPFEDNKIYVFVFDNDLNKRMVSTNYNEAKKEELRDLNIKYTFQNRQIVYDGGEYNLKTTIGKLMKLNNKHFFYTMPETEGSDANDELLKGRLQQLLSGTALKEIATKDTVKYNKKTKETTYWRPGIRSDTPENDLLSQQFVEQGYRYDAYDLSKRFIVRFGDKYKNVKGLGICKYVEEGKYEEDKSEELFDDILQTIKMTYYEFGYILDEEQKRSYMNLWYNDKTGNFKIVSEVEAFLKKSVKLKMDASKFDNENNNVINVNNGSFDMVKQELLPHCPQNLYLRKLNVDYNADLDLNNMNSDWNKFLLSVCCDKINGSYLNDHEGLEKMRFLQKAMGYTFSTLTHEEKIFIVKGVTRSGKNTFLDTIQEVMDDYCGGTQNEEFLTSKSQNNNFLLSVMADLQGKRLIHVSEISKLSKLNANQIKSLTGNRYITAKQMYQKAFKYKQQTKVWITTNNVDFSEFDDSVKEKLIIIDFNKRFYEAGTEEALKTGRVIDKDLKSRLLQKHNKEFILRWILEGFKLYLEEGLKQTKEMKESLEKVAEDNDILGMFVKDSLVEYDPALQKTTRQQKTLNEVYQRYKNYEMDNYETPEDRIMSFRRFTKDLRSRGFDVGRSWSSITLRKELFLRDWHLVDEDMTDIG